MRFFFLTKDRGIFDRYPCFSDLKINPYKGLIISLNTADWHNYLDGWMSNVNYFSPGTLKNSFFTIL